MLTTKMELFEMLDSQADDRIPRTSNPRNIRIHLTKPNTIRFRLSGPNLSRPSSLSFVMD